LYSSQSPQESLRYRTLLFLYQKKEENASYIMVYLTLWEEGGGKGKEAKNYAKKKSVAGKN